MARVIAATEMVSSRGLAPGPMVLRAVLSRAGFGARCAFENNFNSAPVEQWVPGTSPGMTTGGGDGSGDVRIGRRIFGLRHYVAAAALLLSCDGVKAQSYLDYLTAAEPAAAALMVSKAREWRVATEIVKDRAAFMIFTQPFPKKSKMSPNDLIACLDDAAKRSEPEAQMRALIRGCTQ